MKPTIPEVLPLVRQVYSRNAAGCCLHVTLDDHNIKTSHVELCLQTAIEAGHPVCEELARKLLAMSWSQRDRIMTKYYDSEREPERGPGKSG